MTTFEHPADAATHLRRTTRDGDAATDVERTTTGDASPAAARRRPPEPPRGRSTLSWIGPGLLWMISAVGTGSVLFTPRVAANYRYALTWVVPAVCFLMWVMIREAGRYSVVTGDSLLEGFGRLPGPRRWAVWVVYVPQLLAAVVGIAGLAAVTGSAFRAAVGGSHVWWAVGFVAVSTVLVSLGGYRQVEQVARVLAGLLLLITVVAAVQVGPSFGDLGRGLVPGVPADADPGVIVPWIGTILAGSMGIVWFAYWTAARGYGAPRRDRGADADPAHEATGHTVGGRPADAAEEEPQVTANDLARLAGWTRTMSWAAAVGVVGGAVVLLAFTVLGSELLAPEGLVPSGTDVATDLARLLGDVWGRLGFWLMIVAVVVAVGGSVLANQDGWGRSFADMTRILFGRRRLPLGLDDDGRAKRAYVIVVTGLLPMAVVLLVGDPVAIMSVSGVVGAAHTPVIVALILWTNRRELPRTLRPGWTVSALMVGSAAFYAVVGSISLVSG